MFKRVLRDRSKVLSRADAIPHFRTAFGRAQDAFYGLVTALKGLIASFLSAYSAGGIEHRWLLASVAVSLYVGCAPVRFQENLDCSGFTNCVNLYNGTKEVTLDTEIPKGTVDVIFVNDNSASMSPEQQKISERFSSFLASLDEKQVDYRIGIITTDSSASPNNGPRAINQMGAFQDGQLIAFESGEYFLTPQSANRESLFSKAIKRNETLACESFLASNPNASQTGQAYRENCPSGDERGIYTANQFVQSNPQSFIRSKAHLAFVFLGDEDVRSSLYHKTDQSTDFLLDTLDLPQTLISNTAQLYPGKTVSMHALIVRPGALNGISAADAATAIANAFTVGGSLDQNASPTKLFATGDSICLSIQGSQINKISGSYGYLFALGARLTAGIEGSICESTKDGNGGTDSYSKQLKDIAKSIQRSDVSVLCPGSNARPTNIRVNELNNGIEGAQLTENQDYIYNESSSTIKFAEHLSAGLGIRVKAICPAF